jgi:hypothetical protein
MKSNIFFLFTAFTTFFVCIKLGHAQCTLSFSQVTVSSSHSNCGGLDWRSSVQINASALANCGNLIFSGPADDDIFTSSHNQSLTLKEYKVYPNPVSHYINLSNIPQSKEIHIQVFSLFGVVAHSVQCITSGSDTAIDLSTVPTGAYILRVNFVDNQEVLINQIIIKL